MSTCRGCPSKPYTHQHSWLLARSGAATPNTGCTNMGTMDPPEPEAVPRYWQAIEPAWNALDESLTACDVPDPFVEQLHRVEPELRNLFAVYWCDAEVCNGGFHQFFYNHTGVLAPEAAAGFRALKLHECASLLERAMTFFGSPYPRRQSQRVQILTCVPGETREEWDSFYRLDDLFYEFREVESGGYPAVFDTYANQWLFPEAGARPG